MNGKPHTHAVAILDWKSQSSMYGLGDYTWVVYGDTSIRVGRSRRLQRLTPDKYERVLAKAVEKAIRQHDEGSRIAQQRADMQSATLAKMNRVVQERAMANGGRKWGSEA